MSVPTIAVDLDGVVADLTRGLRPIAAEWVGTSESRLPLDVSYGFPEWGLQAQGGYAALHSHAVSEEELFTRLPLISGAREALSGLARSGIRIRLVTQRLSDSNLVSETIEQTTTWLADNKLPFDDLCFVGDKTAVAADLFVEDAPATIQSLRAAGKRTIVFAQPWNRDFLAPRFDNWTHIEQYVSAEFARRITIP